MQPTPELMVIVPTRGRPRNIVEVLKAWRDTDAFDVAGMVVVYDADDEKYTEYGQVLLAWGNEWPVAGVLEKQRLLLVPKLNKTATLMAGLEERAAFALGFAGDDHVPLTPGWAQTFLATLKEMGTGIVYGDDMFQGANLPSQWVMTSDIVRALGRMVPANVEHLYCDNSILDLSKAADCIQYLPDVKIEHRHPIVRKTEWDENYSRFNARAQYRRDGFLYEKWKAEQMAADVATVQRLKVKEEH